MTDPIPSDNERAAGDTSESGSYRLLVTALVIVGVAGLVGRIILLRSPFGALNADEAVTGLTAYDVLRGRPTLLFGASNYGGTIEGWLAAPLVALFGGSRLALKWMTVVEWLGVSIAAAWALRPVLGRQGALAVGGVLWVHSGALVVLSTTVYLGYASGFLAAVLAVGLLVRAVDGDTTRGRTEFAAGLAAGLAVWAHPLFVVMLAPMLVAVTWMRRTANVQRWVIRVVAGGVIGAGPMILWNLKNSGAGFRNPEQTTVTTYRERVEILLAQLTPRALGLRTPEGNWLYPRVLGAAATLAFLVVALGGLIVLARRNRPARVIAAAGLPSLAIFPLFPNTFYANDARYFVMIAVPLLCGLVGLVTWLARRLRWNISAVLATGLVLWGALACGRWFQTIVPRAAFDNDAGVERVVQLLDDRNIRGIAGNYWSVYRIGLASDDRIASVVVVDGPDRFPRERERFERLADNQIAYIFFAGREVVDLVPERGATMETVQLEGFTLFLPRI
jgi:hypothetical protein